MITKSFCLLFFFWSVRCVPVEEATTEECELPEAIPRLHFKWDDQAEDAVAVPANTILEFSCDEGYKLSGNQLLVCMENGEWEDEFPLCKKRLCDELPPVEGGKWSSISRAPKKSRTLKCDKGYSLQDQEASRVKCSWVNKTELEWTGRMPACRKLASCPDPGSPVSGTGRRIPEEGPFYESDEVDFACNEDFEMVGPSFIRCGPDSNWNFPKPRCKPNVSCDDLPPDPHGHYVLPSKNSTADYYVPDDRVVLECHQGYSVDFTEETADDTVYCQDDGVWMDIENLSSCVANLCNKPDLSGAAYIEKEDVREVYQYQDEVKIRCPPGYRLWGYSWNRCAENGWLHPNPTCKEVTCRLPTNPDYGYITGSSPFTVNSTVTYSCFDSYYLTGPSVQTCMANGQWDGTPPVCTLGIIDGCPDPGKPMDGDRTGDSFGTGDTVRFKCNSRFSLIGSEFRTCQPDGEWDGKQPRCRGFNDVDSDQDIKVKLWNELDTKVVVHDSERNSSGSGLEGMQVARILDTSIRDSGGHLVFYFVFDSSDSVGHHNFNISMKFAKAIVHRVGLSGNVHVGVVTFGKYAKRELFPINNTREQVTRKLSNVTYIGGGTATKDALEEVQVMVATVNVHLKKTKSVVFLLTDGIHNVGGTPFEKAAQLKKAGVEIYVIGLMGHKEVNMNNLKKLATTEEHIFYVEGFETLEFLVDQMLTNKVDYTHCGISVRNESNNNQAARIIGGQNVEIYWPWMAHLKIRVYDPHKKHAIDSLCGGSILDNYWILTASHCLQDKLKNNIHPDNITVTVGLLQMDGDEHAERQKRAVDKLWLHPHYNNGNFDYDVALLKLKKPVVYGKVVRRICLPPLIDEIKKDSYLYRPEEKATVIGFGQTEDSSWSNDLKEVEVLLQTTETCQNSLLNWKAKMTDRMICAGDKRGGKDACQGDSGGPLMQLLHGESRILESYWVQVGVVSWGLDDSQAREKKKCGVRGRYGFYTHLAVVKPWIMQTMLNK